MITLEDGESIWMTEDPEPLYVAAPTWYLARERALGRDVVRAIAKPEWFELRDGDKLLLKR